MSKDWDPTKFCRDEHCEIERLHPPHRRLKRVPVLHHRPAHNAPLSIDEGRLPKARELLTERVKLAIGKRPTMMQWIQRDIRDDYGEVTDRTVYRHVRYLVQTKQVLKLDLGLAFYVYIDPTSKLVRDRAALHEYMQSNVDCIPASTKASFA